MKIGKTGTSVFDAYGGMKTQSSRISIIDAVRGFAVLWMVLFQVLDFFSRDFQMYGPTWYVFLDYVDWLPIFMFVSGIGVWMMVDKRMKSGFSRGAILFHGLRRYVSYIFIGLLLCLWVFSFQTFLNLNEILVAIGVYASVTMGLLLVFFNREWLFVPLSFLVYGLVFWFKDSLQYQFYPFYWMLPQFFLGAFSARLIVKKSVGKLALFGLFLLAITVVLAFLGDDFSYAAKSLGFVVFNAFLLVATFIAAGSFPSARIGLLSFAGGNALFFYVFHYAVLFKLIGFLNVGQTFDWMSSILLTFLGVAVIFVCAYLKSKLLKRVRIAEFIRIKAPSADSFDCTDKPSPTEKEN
jgi:uncharacterized membrane protein